MTELERSNERQRTTLNVISSIKVLNGYSEVQKSCSTCNNFEEVANLHLDRCWDPVCNIIKESTGILLDVKPHGVCQRWVAKVKK